MTCTLIQIGSLEKMGHYLLNVRESWNGKATMCDSMIRRCDSAVLRPRELAFIQKGDNRKLKCGVLYVPLDSSVSQFWTDYSLLRVGRELSWLCRRHLLSNITRPHQKLFY
ncbi:hypothetical protein TRVL_06968 [Trypanosoma vivax]|nr:hypothetical protein TRVL_06968 [Trypanosoma vivax]